MSDRVEWTIRFLEDYRTFPCLWKKCSIDYKNRSKRDAAEQKLLPLSGLKDIKELRMKIRSIRCTYNQEVGKIKKSMGTGSGSSDVYTPRLGWFSTADNFLRQNLEENDSESNLILPENVLHQEENETISEVQESTNFPLTTPPVVNTPNPRKRPLSFTRQHSQVKNKVDVSLDNAVDVLKQVANRQTLNEFVSFGHHVASQLQCLPLEESITLQEQIQKLITDARFRVLRTQPSVHTMNIQTPSSSEIYQTSPSHITDVPLEPQNLDEQYLDMNGRRECTLKVANYFTNWSVVNDDEQ